MTGPMMRSNEVAALAHVTVRTLRHYHQIGLLPEPPRSANGYRAYTVHDLAALLRIQSFTELGVPLSEVRRVLDDQAATAELLDRIDQQTAGEIERLTARRAIIARLRAQDVAPDLPPDLIPYADLLRSRPGADERERVHDREQLALLRRFSDAESMQWLVAAVSSLAGAPARYHALMDEFAGLAADASDADVAILGREMADVLGAAVPRVDPPPLNAEAVALIVAHQDARHNDAQRRVLEVVLRHLGA